MRKKSTKTKKRKIPLKRKINKILVPIDGSRNSFRALDFAISISKSLDATISAISVVDLPPVLEYAVLDPVSKRLESKEQRFLKKAETLAQKNNIKFNSKVIHGKTGQAVVKYSKKGGFDMIVMGARGIGGVSSLLVGSVSNYVIQKSKIPVVIIK